MPSPSDKTRFELPNLQHAIYDPELPATARKSAIEKLARSLDVIEETAAGPLLAGSRCTSADASIFPSMALFAKTLVPHFGWTPWTEEALFYRRPRLHAWWELMQYESAAATVDQIIADNLEALQVDWEDVAFEVPTSKLRSYPRHTF